MNKYLLIIFSSCMLISCNEIQSPDPNGESYDYSIAPKHFPPIPFPNDNPYSREKFILGRQLFYDPLLSPDGSVKSCSHCLKQEHNFADNVAVSLGLLDQPQARNTMPLTNTAFMKQIFWDGRSGKIESPAYRSFFLPNVFGSDTNDVNRKLRASSKYRSLFRIAFGAETEPSVYHASLAISTFVRCLVSGNSAYDRFINGDSTAMNKKAKRGMELFFSEKTRCSVCHSGLFFTDGKFHNTGVITHYFDWGRYYITGLWADRGKFITPSLRNCEASAPYMHDGEILDLSMVLEHYNRGGRPFINKDTLLRPLNLTGYEKEEIVEFLKSLTDWEFLRSKKFSNPNKN